MSSRFVPLYPFSFIPSPLQISPPPLSLFPLPERADLTPSDFILFASPVSQNKKTGDKAIGRYLMDTFGMGTEEMERGGFTGSLQDTLMMSYLANLVRAQAEVSSRLALVTAA